MVAAEERHAGVRHAARRQAETPLVRLQGHREARHRQETPPVVAELPEPARPPEDSAAADVAEACS